LLEPVKDTKVIAKAFDIATGKKLAEETIAESVEITSNGAIEFEERDLPGWDGKPRTDVNVVVSVQLFSSDGKQIAKAASWPEPLKYLSIAGNPGLSVNVKGEKFTATTEKPVKGALMEIIEGDDDTVVFSDNGFDVMPGETVEGTVTGLGGAKIGLRHLGMVFEKEERKLGEGVWCSPRKY
jgi:beta-mannosidase